ncbi:conserved exported protein of unknown function [Pseudodesulfovibrio piezophilus C1TLV30]|uniref:Uncharacterized protein n=1 Tax=Pseudodesulfovibrio piezophilus (strain DSM 21447 / JCM 15486 / C1TLV30) TaxID=1322246 RepID=M1WXZ4_PSEP2|nr:conserved exported protein of unknown function [Pseudodesulfovibrio piezophilus C1TLV30]
MNPKIRSAVKVAALQAAAAPIAADAALEAAPAKAEFTVIESDVSYQGVAFLSVIPIGTRS